MIYSDKPRRYAKRGSKWAHVFADDYEELRDFGRRHGLKRFHGTPWPHFDVLESELADLPLRVLDRREAFEVLLLKKRVTKRKKRG